MNLRPVDHALDPPQGIGVEPAYPLQRIVRLRRRLWLDRGDLARNRVQPPLELVPALLASRDVDGLGASCSPAGDGGVPGTPVARPGALPWRP